MADSGTLLRSVMFYHMRLAGRAAKT
jgi:hypothetical protein